MQRTARSERVDLAYLLEVAAIAAAYVAFAKLGFSLAFSVKQVTAVWLPAGIALAALLLRGYRVWPAIWLGAFVGNALSHEPAFTAAGIATGNTIGPLVGAFLMRRYAGFDEALERVRDVLALLLLGSLGAMTVTATNGVLNLAAAGIIPWHAYGLVWWMWWVGDAMGVLLFAPLILTWAVRHRFQWQWARALEVGVLFVTLFATTWLTFMKSGSVSYPVYPFVIWSALRFRQRTTALAVVVIYAIAVWATTHGRGPFIAGSLDHRLVQLVISMGVLALTGLTLGAIVAERRLARAQFQAAERGFQVLAEALPQMVWTADASGWIDWYNHRWYEYTGQTPQEAAGWGWQRSYHPEDFPRVMQAWPRSIATGERFDMECRIRARDGSFRWFLERAEPLRDSGGAIVRWYGTITDIEHQKRALEQTTRIAQTLQAAFIPENLPRRSGLRFDALYLAAGKEALIGGDWYDAFECADGRIVISIGDVAGHGLRAAITAGRVRQGIFAEAFDTLDPAEILRKINGIFHAQETTIATALVATIDPNLQTLRYASAGHPPPMIAGRTIAPEVLQYGGLPLGVSPALHLQTTRVDLERDAVILFYTDGVTEFDRDIESTEQKLLRALSRMVGDATLPRPAVALQREVMGRAKPQDDAVLMVLQLSPGVTADVPFDIKSLRKTWTFHSSDAYSAQTSRHELMNFLRAFVASEDDLFRSELILGEVLANTVEHAPGLVDIEIDWSGMYPIVTIADTGPGLSRFAPELPQDTLSENGRGLFLIYKLAVAVHLEPSADRGTRIRIVLPVRRDQAFAAAGDALLLGLSR
jgi:PAS domain S-box-containing protein